MAEQLPSRAALLELRRERAVIDQGYRFLDEKRIALGQELMNMLREHARLAGEFRSATMEARTALAKALERHGLESLQLYPAAPADRWSLQRRESRFLGLAVLAEAQLVGEHGGGADAGLPRIGSGRALRRGLRQAMSSRRAAGSRRDQFATPDRRIPPHPAPRARVGARRTAGSALQRAPDRRAARRARTGRGGARAHRERSSESLNCNHRARPPTAASRTSTAAK